MAAVSICLCAGEPGATLSLEGGSLSYRYAASCTVATSSGPAPSAIDRLVCRPPVPARNLRGTGTDRG